MTQRDRTIKRAALALAVAGFAALAGVLLARTGSLRDGLDLALVVPVALAGLVAGPGAGLGIGALALAVVAGAADLHGTSVPAAAYCSRAAVFVVAGGLVGALARRREAASGTDSRWFELSNELLAEVSLDGYFTRLSRQWELTFGWTREELMSRPFRSFVHPDDLAATNVHADALELAPGEVRNFENRYLAKDGSWRWLLWTARSDAERKYGVARDITDRKRLEEERQSLIAQVEAMARTDALTGLPNRRAWDEEVILAVARSERTGRALALAMLDLDDFKAFNDAYGHASGDELLVEAATGWRLSLRVTDFLARYGGEEFAILLPECAPEDAASLLERLRIATPRGQTCSVGIAFWDGIEGPGELVARADGALYEAKRRGRDRVVAADDNSWF